MLHRRNMNFVLPNSGDKTVSKAVTQNCGTKLEDKTDSGGSINRLTQSQYIDAPRFELFWNQIPLSLRSLTF